MIHLTKHKLIFTIVLCLLCGVKMLFACDCPGITVEDAVKKSSLVFSGKVISFEYRRGIPNWFMDEQAKLTGKSVDYETLVVKLQVEQWWKGEAPLKIYLLTDHTKNADNSSTLSSCDFTFQKDETYLIYATGEPNEYRTNNCLRTKMLSQAEKDLKILGDGKEPLEKQAAPNKK